MSQSKSAVKIWDIKATQAALGEDVCTNLLFAHAIGGCDTTSSVFSVGKVLPLKKLRESPDFRQQAAVFLAQSTAKAVKKAGEKALVQLLGGESKDTLDSLRHVKYMQKLSSHSGTMAVQPQKLPPTNAAAKFHSTRVYLQIAVQTDALVGGTALVCSVTCGDCRGDCCMNSIVNMEEESFENASDNESDC
ncbi:hypothetical protein BaRGS_00036277 [Batillaria attramentaria]|uniref:Uncharacterized protein n=1 Tax=Batillaria attramentaria TaxID=370345 RepID=A0ABD0JCF7_9CAEN